MVGSKSGLSARKVVMNVEVWSTIRAVTGSGKRKLEVVRSRLGQVFQNIEGECAGGRTWRCAQVRIWNEEIHVWKKWRLTMEVGTGSRKRKQEVEVGSGRGKWKWRGQRWVGNRKESYKWKGKWNWVGGKDWTYVLSKKIKFIIGLKITYLLVPWIVEKKKKMVLRLLWWVR